jgi:hypothetical protein
MGFICYVIELNKLPVFLVVSALLTTHVNYPAFLGPSVTGDVAFLHEEVVLAETLSYVIYQPCHVYYSYDC